VYYWILQSKPPVTPPRKLFLHVPPLPLKSKPKKTWPTRDSPDNPFPAGEDEASTSKASGWESSDDELPVGEARERESMPTPALVFEEKPTITYVSYVYSTPIILYPLTPGARNLTPRFAFCSFDSESLSLCHAHLRTFLATTFLSVVDGFTWVEGTREWRVEGTPEVKVRRWCEEDWLEREAN
jgi:hypothetical protein